MEQQFDKNCENCIWWNTFACDGKPVALDCNRAITLQENKEEYHKIYDAYEQDCQAALEPVYDKYKQIFAEHCLKDYDIK